MGIRASVTSKALDKDPKIVEAFNRGDLLALLSMAMWGSYTVVLRLRRDTLDTPQYLTLLKETLLASRNKGQAAAGDIIAITGDLVVWPVPLIGNTAAPLEYAATLQRLLELNAAVFVPGHGPMSTFGEERRSNPFAGDAAVGARR